MALSNALNEILYRLKNLSNNRQRESEIAASVNQINAALKLIAAEIETLVITGGGVTVHNLLSGKGDVDQHPISAISGLVEALNVKANSSHTHGITDVTGLQSAIDGKQNKIIQSATPPESPQPGDLWIQT